MVNMEIFVNPWALTGCAVTLGTMFCYYQHRSQCQRKRSSLFGRRDMQGKTCIITSISSAADVEVIKELLCRGATVHVGCRNVRKTSILLEKTLDINMCSAHLTELDLTSLESVRYFASFINSLHIKNRGIDILINNGEVLGTPYSNIEDKHELHFAANHLGHFLLTNLLLPRLKNSVDARIIMVSSPLYKKALVSHFFYLDKDFTPGQAYAMSKLANILFTTELSKRLPNGLAINAMYHGNIFTEFFRVYFGDAAYDDSYVIRLCRALRLLPQPETLAKDIVRMATEPSLRGVSGQCFVNCKIEELSDNAKDQKTAENLFLLSEELCDTKCMYSAIYY